MSIMDANPDSRPQPHQRTRSGISFKSGHSSKSQSKSHKLTETTAEKAKRHLSHKTKADPNAAMNEAQPVATALEASTIGSLRSMPHRDESGSLIAEPDLSNPTRYRWERPLDTIRSFEASVDGAYKRRSMIQADVGSDNRYSYAGSRGHDFNASTSGQYKQRISNADDMYGQGYGVAPHITQSRNRYGQRLVSESPLQSRSGNSYDNHSPVPRQRVSTSPDNRSSGSPSEPWASSTEPSSEENSINRVIKAELGEQPANGIPAAEHRAHHPQDHTRVSPNEGYLPERAIAQGAAPQRTVIKLGPGSPDALTPSTRPASLLVSEKRKSWFKRTFSKRR